MNIRIEARNFKALRHVDFRPRGVCALAGPNAAGKTTLLQVLEFLRLAWEQGVEPVVQHFGGVAAVRSWDAAPDEPVLLACEVEGARWEVRFGAAAGAIRGLVETVTFDGAEVIRSDVATGQIIVAGHAPLHLAGRSALLTATEHYPHLHGPKAIGLLHQALQDFQLLMDPALRHLRDVGSKEGSEDQLSPDGRNAFSLLRNWIAGAKGNRERVDFVRGALAEAFPSRCVDFEFPKAGRTVTAQFYPAGRERPEPVDTIANGILSALVTLCAVASGYDEGLVFIDEPENGLHPFAIRKLVAAMRERAAQKNLTIVLATHSPVLLSEFNADRSRVFVMERDEPTVPVVLDQHWNPDWLSHFSVGDLYSQLDIGAPAIEASTPHDRG